MAKSLTFELVFMNQIISMIGIGKSSKIVLLLVLKALCLVFWQQFCNNCVAELCPEKQLVIIAIFLLIFLPNCNRDGSDGTPWSLLQQAAVSPK